MLFVGKKLEAEAEERKHVRQICRRDYGRLTFKEHVEKEATG